MKSVVKSSESVKFWRRNKSREKVGPVPGDRYYEMNWGIGVDVCAIP